MPRTHRTLDGAWEACEAEACTLLFHVELTVAEAAALPEHVFQQLADAVDPPHRQDIYGTLYWTDKAGATHRDYDLPAMITSTARFWLQHGQRTRAGDKPSTVNNDGTLYWFDGNDFHREGGRPAVINADGTLEWWVNGKRHRAGGMPAVLDPDGHVEYWEHGVRWHPGADEGPYRQPYYPSKKRGS